MVAGVVDAASPVGFWHSEDGRARGFALLSGLEDEYELERTTDFVYCVPVCKNRSGRAQSVIDNMNVLNIAAATCFWNYGR